jgi:flagellar hook-associated protein FlgK
MSSVSAIAASGILTAAARVQASAVKVADPSSKNDLGTEAANQAEAGIGFAANALVLRAANQMTDTLVDMLA